MILAVNEGGDHCKKIFFSADEGVMYFFCNVAILIFRMNHSKKPFFKTSIQLFIMCITEVHFGTHTHILCYT